MTDCSLEVSKHLEDLANGELRSQCSVIPLSPGGDTQFAPRSTPLMQLTMHISASAPIKLTADLSSSFAYPKTLQFLPLDLFRVPTFTSSPVCLYLLNLLALPWILQDTSGICCFLILLHTSRACSCYLLLGGNYII
jgi:hypothetical protein